MSQLACYPFPLPSARRRGTSGHLYLFWQSKRLRFASYGRSQLQFFTSTNKNMPFYQMLCIASHFREYKHIKELVTMSAKHIMDQGGVVRNVEYWGTQTLPQPMRRHRQVYTIGDYWTMYFDTSPHGLRSLTGVIRRDPRVIRWTMLKQGDKVGDVVLPREKTVTRTDYLNPPRDGSTSWSELDI